MGTAIHQTVGFEPFDNTFFSVTFELSAKRLMTHVIGRARISSDLRIFHNTTSGETE